VKLHHLVMCPQYAKTRIHLHVDNTSLVRLNSGDFLSGIQQHLLENMSSSYSSTVVAKTCKRHSSVKGFLRCGILYQPKQLILTVLVVLQEQLN
jgi:hypothetical protein